MGPPIDRTAPVDPGDAGRVDEREVSPQHEVRRRVGREVEHAFVPQTFVGNHDKTRIATRIEFPHDPSKLSPLGLPTFHHDQASTSGRDRLVVLLDVSDDGGSFDVPGAGEVLAGSARVSGSRVELPAHGWAVLAG